MKLIVLFVTLFSFNCFAQSVAQSELTATPYIPANCEDGDYRYINKVFDIQKLEETADTVVFAFKSVNGFCKDGEYVVRPLYSKLVYVGVLRYGYKDGLNVQHETSQDSSYETVRVAFDKGVAFKKSNNSLYRFGFYPEGAFSYVYHWELSLTQLSDNSAKLEIFLK